MSVPSTAPRRVQKRGPGGTLLPAVLALAALAALLAAVLRPSKPDAPAGPAQTESADAAADPAETEDTGAAAEDRYEAALQSALDRIDDAALREAFAQMGAENPEAEAFIVGFEGVTDYDLTLDLTGELTPGQVPYLTQWDLRWGCCRYGEGLMGWTGCGPTALSMAAMAVTGDGTLTPAYIASFAIEEGYCVPGNGTAWTLFSEGAGKLGLRSRELPLWEPTIRAELEAGRPVICIMGPGHFTKTGHYIVLTGCTAEGFSVYDPFRPSNCRVWSYADLEGEIKNLWSYAS